MNDLSNWQSFWDLASPEKGAQQMRDIFGLEAVKAASGCASAAQADDRDEDFRFWTAVVARLQVASPLNS